ncbi:MAG: 2Fe-2S iron-sulfur cluster-binding protein [Candidatus Thiodiazotropha sp.]
MTTGLLALIIALAILLQLLLALTIGVWRKRNSLGSGVETPAATAVTNHFSQVEKNEAVESGWQGFVPFRVIRRVGENVTGDICSFFLQPCEPIHLPDFLPGQYLTLKFELPVGGENGLRTVTRCYSLSDRPRRDYYRISVKRATTPAAHPEAPTGVVSNYLHDRIEVGDQLMIKAPSGSFHLLDEPALPLVLIAGGIGITPMLSIINTLLEQGSKRETWLFYGVGNGREVIMHGLLQRLEQTLPHFHLHLCYSRPDPRDRIGTDYQHRGHVDMALLQDVLKLGRYHYYICGPSAMMESMVPGLQALGVPSSDIRYEAFGPASPAKAVVNERKRSISDDESLEVSFSKSKHSARWSNGHDSLLNFIEAEGIAVDSACRSGSCGSCRTKIESGEVAYHQELEVEVETGHCLLCVSRPASNLKLAL